MIELPLSRQEGAVRHRMELLIDVDVFCIKPISASFEKVYWAA